MYIMPINNQFPYEMLVSFSLGFPEFSWQNIHLLSQIVDELYITFLPTVKKMKMGLAVKILDYFVREIQ